MSRAEKKQEKLFKRLKKEYLKLETIAEKKAFKKLFFKLKGMSEETLSDGWEYITL